MRFFLGLIVAVLLIVLVPQALFTVDRTEYVYLTQFGRPVATYDGENSDEAGLHLKWPWPVQAVQRLDHRLQYFDLPAAELLTHDPRGQTIDRTVTIDGYVCWRDLDEQQWWRRDWLGTQITDYALGPRPPNAPRSSRRGPCPSAAPRPSWSPT